VKLDFSEAAKWVRRAAELGYARAQLDLGYLYEQGKGVPMDYIVAYMWYKAAVDRGERRGITPLRNLSSVMTKPQIKQASVAAAELKIPASVTAGDSLSDSMGISFLPPR
jgi:hypothetical protein